MYAAAKSSLLEPNNKSTGLRDYDNDVLHSLSTREDFQVYSLSVKCPTQYMSLSQSFNNQI